MPAPPESPRALSWPRAGARRLWGSASQRAAGPLLYVAVLTLVAKLTRGAELAVRVDSPAALFTLPLTVGQDLVLIAAVGLAADALSRIRSQRVSIAGLLLLLVPLALLLPADVVAHRLTGGPITWQRLRGDEGATLADVGLLSTQHLLFGLVAILVALAAIYPALRWRPSFPWLRAWARPRLLLVTMLTGYGLTLVQPLVLPRAQGLAEQPLFVLAASLIEPTRLKPIVLGKAEWRALHRPARELGPPPAAPRVAARAKNVIVFLAEGIAFEHTGFDPQTVAEEKLLVAKARGKEKNTKKRSRLRKSGDPTEYLSARHARHGLLFDRYHANWHASIQAIFSIVCSAFPPMRGDIVRTKPRIDCGEFSEMMRDHGISAGLFHGGTFNFYNKLALLGQRGYQVELDAEDLAKRSKHREHQWGIDDRAVVDATLEWIDALPEGQRFAALLIPITAHYPYWVPRDFERPFPGSARRQRFLGAVAFQDEVVEQLLRGLEKRGLYDDTLFVWLGDHGHHVGEPARATPGLRGFYEPNIHVPLVLINPKMFPDGRPESERVSSRLGGHTDLLPTILDALGLPFDPRHQGQSLIGDDYEHRRQFFAADNGRYVGFIEGDHKFALEPRANRVEYYDLRADPDELEDLSETDPAAMRRNADTALLFARAVEGNIEAAGTLHEAVSVEHVYERFMEHARVRVIAPGATDTPPTRGAPGKPIEPAGSDAAVDPQAPVECTREGKQILCPGLDSPLRIKQGRVQGEMRRCVMVPVPREGAIDLSVTDPETFALMTGTIVALPKQRSKKVRFRIKTFADGVAQGTVTLSHELPARPRHPRPQKSIRYTISMRPDRERPQATDGGVHDPQATPASAPVCLQLTTLVTQ